VAKRIFVVDDERCISDSLSAILNNCGFKASAFYNAESALAACETATPELVISDVVMPGMSGVEMAIVIKEHYPACKILLFSGQTATADMLEQARSKGYDFELLAKPVHPKELLARVADREERQPRPHFDSTARVPKTA
jgi:DNA-binding NtrC family response regulator